MKLEDIQSEHAALLNADAGVAAFGTVLVYDPLADEDAAKAAIDARLRDAGVCIEIGGVEADGRGERPNNRFTLLNATFDVYIAEAIKVAHTPQNMQLVRLVAAALQKRPSAEHSAVVIGYARAMHEHGYVLHVLTCSIPATL